MSTAVRSMMKPVVDNYFVCSAQAEYLSDAARELEERVKGFLDIGCELHGPTIVLLEPEILAGFFRARQPRRFWLSQTVIRKKIIG